MHLAQIVIAARRGLFIVTMLGGMTPPAQAIVKCNGAGSVEYTDGECANAHAMALTDLRTTDTLNADRAEAARRAAADKAELIRLETARNFSEQQTEKMQQRRMSAIRLRRERCQTLLLRKKWLEEDRHEATSRRYRTSGRKSQRLAEKYAIACGS